MRFGKKRLFLVLMIALIFVLVGCSQKSNQQENLSIDKKALIMQLNLKENAEVILLKSEDVTGDDVKDKIALTGERPDEQSNFFDNLTVVVQDGKSEKYAKATYQNFSGYEPELEFKDFSGDKIKDVFVKAAAGGSAGIVNHLIAAFKDNKPQVIFDNENNKGVTVTGSFIPEFKAKLKFKELNKEAILDLSVNKDEYIKQKIYNQDGKLIKKEITPYANYFSKLEAVDYNKDGKYEVKGYQKIVGAYNADKISELVSLWQYQNGEWSLGELQYSTFLLKYNPNRIENPGILGSIKNIEKRDGRQYILVSGEPLNSNSLSEILLLVNKDTILTKEDGDTAVTFDDLKVGMKVKAYHQLAVTRSIPPQSTATKIIILKES